jgi:hypothetical protein
MKKFILPIILLIALAGGYGYYEYNRPVKSLSKANADMTIASNELLAAFESNETAANTTYLDKVVEVSGKVSNIETTEGKTHVTLETQNPMSGIICELEENQNLGNIKTGDQVSIKGKCTGYLSDVILNQAIILKK